MNQAGRKHEKVEQSVTKGLKEHKEHNTILRFPTEKTPFCDYQKSYDAKKEKEKKRKRETRLDGKHRLVLQKKYTAYCVLAN